MAGSHTGEHFGAALVLTPFRAADGLEGYVRQDEQSVLDTLDQIARRVGLHYEPRWFVWDVAWTMHGDVVAGHNKVALELWGKGGERIRHVPDPWDAVQLMLGPTGDIYVKSVDTRP